MNGTGWIKLFRSLKEWEWYDDKNATRLLVHLLISVNYEDKNWKGIMIKAGSMVLSWDSLSEASSLSVSECRTSMKKLISSKEVSKLSTNKFQVITLLKWDKLQLNDDDVDKQIASTLTNKSQTNRKQIATTKEYKEYKKDKNKENYKVVLDKILLSEIEISDVELNLRAYFKSALLWQRLIVKNLEEKKAPTRYQKNTNFKNYVDPIRLMFDRDDVKKEQMRLVYNYLDSPQGEFWKDQILSTAKLREKFQQLVLKAQNNSNGQINSQKKSASTYSRSEAVDKAQA